MRTRTARRAIDALDQAFAYFYADAQRSKKERDEAETALAQMYSYYA